MAVNKVTPTENAVMQVVAVPTVKPTEYKFREMLNRKNANAIEILHDIPQADFVDGCWQKTWKMCCPCCFCECKCLRGCKELDESTYTYVMENRMEFNRPFLIPKMEFCSICRCRCKVVDMTRVEYFDSDMFDYVNVCNPCCYDCQTWCCGSAGETIQFKRPILCCPSAKWCGCTVATIQVTNGTAQKVTVLINEAKDNARAKMTYK